MRKNTRTRHTDLSIMQSAMQCEARADWRRLDGRAYDAARHRGAEFFLECTEHMRPRNRHSDDYIFGAARACSTKSEWRSVSPGTHSAAKRRGRDFYNSCTSHMRSLGNLRRRCVYVIAVNATVEAYIGLTLNIEKRVRQHATRREVISRAEGFSVAMVCDYVEVTAAQAIEAATVDAMRADGWVVLNVARAGSAGAPRERKWTLGACVAEASKYTRRIDFEAGSSGAYAAVLLNGWSGVAMAHMPIIDYKARGEARRKWTRDICAAAAAKHQTRSAFQRDCNGAYQAALKFGWIEEICAHMRFVTHAERGAGRRLRNQASAQAARSSRVEFDEAPAF